MPGSIRLFVNAPLCSGETIAASPQQTHYLAAVMRRAPGDPIHLFNGRDGEFSALIETIRRDHANLRVDRRLRPQAPEPGPWLAFALLKRDATDLVVQKATELGAAALLPIITERSNTHRMNEARLTGIAIEAAEQCERLSVPHLHPVRSLDAMLHDWPPDRRLFVAAERTNAPSIASLPVSPPDGEAALLVGPEGGLTPAELDAMRARPFVTLVSLGPHILRAETACIAGLALLQAVETR